MARRLVTRNGEQLNVDESEVMPGDVVATEAGNHPILAAANAGLSALTFGATDAQATDKEYIKNLRAENPVAAPIGTVIGEVVQGALVPEVKAAGLVGNLAIQGGLSGIGSQISEAYLNDRPVDTELLVGDVLSRAATGAGVGKAFQVTGKLVSKVAGKAGEFAASERVVNAAKNVRKNVLKKSLGLDDDLFKYADEQGFFASTSHEGVASMASEAERRAGAKAAETWDKAVETFPDLKPLRDEWLDLAIETGPKNARRMREIAKELDLAFPKPAAEAGKTVSGRAPPQTPAQSIRDFGEELLQSKEIREKALDASKKASFDIGESVKGAVFPGIFAVFPGIFAGPKAVAGMVGKDLFNSVASNRGGYLAGRALQKIEQGQVLPRVFKGFQAKVEGMLATAPGVLGPFATVLGHAAAAGTEQLLATHSALAQSAQGPEYLARMGMTPESAEQVAAYGQKLAMLEAVEAQRKAFETDVSKASRAFLRGDSFVRAPVFNKLSKKDFSTKIATLQEALRDPSKLAAGVPPDVFTGAPSLSVDAGRQALLATQFLVDRAPKPNDLWKPVSLRKPFEPGAAELQKWQRFVDAVTDPKAAAMQIARGQASPEAVETVKTLYPNLFSKVQARVMAELSQINKPLPYDRKQALSKIFGPQITGMTQQSQIYLQSVHQAASMPPQEQNPGQSPSNDGRQMVNTNKNMQTQTQRLEGRN